MSVPATILRHRTAMVRHSLSQPMSLLVQYGLVHSGTTVFDYGCGQGGDLRALSANGIDVRGWDPHFAPNEPKSSADIVNLGFVLNVIEDQEERRAALVDAWRLTGETLAVSTMIAGQVPTDGLKSYRDGYVTTRGTFQKYFAHAELREVIADATDTDPVAAAPGIFFAFRRAEAREDFLLRRRIDRRSATSGSGSRRSYGASGATVSLTERIQPALLEIAEIGRMRGRLPSIDDISSEIQDLLVRERVSFKRALDISLATTLPADVLEGAAAAMREDLLVHDALSCLGGASRGTRMSGAMTRDVKAHFGSVGVLRRASTAYLMALGDEAALRQEAERSAARGIGALDHRGRMLVDGRRAEDLPGKLRTYMGCGAVLSGEPPDDAVVRIDFERRTIEHLRMKDRKAHFPLLHSSTRVDLKRQTVSVRPIDRILLSRSLVLGPPTKAQSSRETKVRARYGIPDMVMTIRPLLEGR